MSEFKKAPKLVPESSTENKAPLSPNDITHTMKEVYKDAEKGIAGKNKTTDKTDNSKESNS